VPADGNLFKRAWLARYAGPLQRKPGHQIVQSWDTAAKLADGNDYSVGTTWLIDGSQFYLLDVQRGRWEFPDLLRTVTAEAMKYSAGTILIEDASSGAALVQSLRHQSRLNIIPIKATADKRTRAAQQSATFEARRVRLPETAAWLAEFEQELLAFPNGRHDDQVDSSVQFLQWASERNRFTGIALGGVVVPLAGNDEKWRVPSGW
jgi:predicted phage terminase large subunit-like protein